MTNLKSGIVARFRRNRRFIVLMVCKGDDGPVMQTLDVAAMLANE